MSPNAMTSLPSPEHHHHHHLKKKRVGKACDLCRIKKTKCDGKKPCNRCVLDNKICLFTEKRKQKEKAHPLGYVELLETRLDLLTKSLEKIILLLRPHLPFVDELIEKHNASAASRQADAATGAGGLHAAYSQLRGCAEDLVVPINDIISHLISEKGLLSNRPIEWERGALIAAKLQVEIPGSVEEASHKFAEHRQENSELNLPEEEAPLVELVPLQDPENSVTDQFKLGVFSLGGYSSASGIILGGALDTDLAASDFDSDNNSIYSSSNLPISNPATSTTYAEDSYFPNYIRPGSPDALAVDPLGEILPNRTHSLFLQNLESLELPEERSGSLSSLAGKLELHLMIGATPGSHKRGSSITRPLSPSFHKAKNSFHVLKLHRSHSRSLLATQLNTVVSNHGNDFHLPSYMGQQSGRYQDKDFINATLPSDDVGSGVLLVNDFQDSDILELDDTDSVLATAYIVR